MRRAWIRIVPTGRGAPTENEARPAGAPESPPRARAGARPLEGPAGVRLAAHPAPHFPTRRSPLCGCPTSPARPSSFKLGTIFPAHAQPSHICHLSGGPTERPCCLTGERVTFLSLCLFIPQPERIKALSMVPAARADESLLPPNLLICTPASIHPPKPLCFMLFPHPQSMPQRCRHRFIKLPPYILESVAESSFSN